MAEKFDLEQQIGATVGEVWKVLTNKDEIGKWMPKGDYVAKTEINEKELALWDTIIVKKGLIEIHFKVTKKENHCLVLTSGSGARGFVRFDLDVGERGTKVKVHGEFNGLMSHFALSDIKNFFSLAISNMRGISETEEKNVKDWLKREPLL